MSEPIPTDGGGGTFGSPLAHARHWAALGFRCFPVIISQREDGTLDKRPGVAHGFHAATTDSKELASLFNLHPLPGTEVVVGIVPGSAGYVVLDCDVKHGMRGPETADQADLPGVVVSTTPSGGEHRWYRKPSDALIGNRSPWGGVDVRSDAGYVIAPGQSTSWGSWAMTDSLDDSPTLPAHAWGLLHEATAHGVDLPTELAPETEEAAKLLVSLGGSITRVRGGVIDMARPGKPGGVSATVGALGPGFVYNFSSSWPTVPANTALVVYERTLMSPAERTRRKVQALTENLTPARSSWAGMEADELAHLVKGEVDLDVPTILNRVDGPALFYKGKVNVVFGQSEAGKSWVAIVACAQVLAEGGSVAYADLEDSPKGILERFASLGVDLLPYISAGTFRYIRPTGPIEVAPLAGLDLLVIDSANELLTLNVNAALNDATFITAEYRTLRKVAADLNLCVVLIDHSTNKGDSGTVMGSSSKRNAVDGVEVKVENVVPFSRTQAGWSALYITKDRPGQVDGVDHRKASARHRSRAWAAMTVQADLTPLGTLGTSVTLEEPRAEQREERKTNEWREDAVLACLAEHGNRMKRESVEAWVDFSYQEVKRAIRRLLDKDLVHEVADPADGRSPWVVLGPKPSTEGLTEV